MCTSVCPFRDKKVRFITVGEALGASLSASNGTSLDSGGGSSLSTTTLSFRLRSKVDVSSLTSVTVVVAPLVPLGKAA
ncbi:hypothetical protein SFRURICE_010989 [Spodoptera frugiperda]|nr:hypothetical protein SFRURICE_010989 [Spodoptera frugiperda]